MIKKISVLLLALLGFAAFSRAQGTCPAGTPNPGNNCYFIAANGSDSNNGTSESTPWLHAPGMATCTGNCAAVSPAPGMGFIFRGGDTWHFGNGGASPYTGGEWAMNNWWGTDASCQYEGTAAGCIYWGVDRSWSNSGSWTRPILNADNPLSTTPVSSCAYQVGGANVLVQAGVADYIDNFEWTGFCSSRNPASGGPFTDMYLQYGGSGISGSGMLLISNNYFHGWTVTTTAGQSNSTIPCTIINGGDNGLQSMWNNVVDGVDSVSNGCSWATFPSFYHFKDNVIRFTTQGVGQWCHDIHDNIFEYMQGPIWPTHANVLECNADSNGTATNQPAGTPNVIYNNILRHDAAGVVSNPDLWVCPNATPEYWFGNLLYDLAGEGWSIAGPAGYGCNNSGGQYMFNNTLVDMTQPCSLNPLNNGTGGQYLTVLNETLINAGFDTFSSPGCTGMASATNVAMSDGTAIAQGYLQSGGGITHSQSCANESLGLPCAEPTGGSTLNAGQNFESYCATLAGFTSEYAISTEAANACKYGTTDAIAYNVSTHTVSYPAQTAVARPTSGPWDSGPYQGVMSGGGGGAPAPTITSVTASCTPSGVAVGNTSNCSATVTGTGSYSLAVNWSAAYGTVSASGLYTAPTTQPPGGLDTISASSQENPSVSGATTIAVEPASFSPVQGARAAAVSPYLTAAVTLAAAPHVGNLVLVGFDFFDGTEILPTVSVADSNGNAYTISPNSPSNGQMGTPGAYAGAYYTAYLINAPSNASATITATFSKAAHYSVIRADEFAATGPVAFDKDVAGSGIGTAINSPSITPAAAGELLYAAGNPGLAITSANVPWTQDLAGIDTTSAGTDGEFISSSASGATAINFTQSASAAWDAMAMAFEITSSTITSVSASCSPASVLVSTTSNCAQTVAGTGSFSSAVTWSAAHGTISGSGVYTAPATIPSGGTDTITATSTQDETKSGAFAITITAGTVSVPSAPSLSILGIL